VIDPRLAAARKKLLSVGRVLAVASGKGGVGKTLTSVLLALRLRDLGFSTGLLDLDLTNPSCHVLLGADVERNRPVEDAGIVPPLERGLRFLSVAHFSGDAPVSLRGHEADSAIKELLAIARWEGVEVLVVDTPPGLGDELLTLPSLAPHAEFVVVSTPTPLGAKALEKTVAVLRSVGRVAGVVENMWRPGAEPSVEAVARSLGERFLGRIPYVEGLDEEVARIGVESALRKRFAAHLDRILAELGLLRSEQR